LCDLINFILIHFDLFYCAFCVLVCFEGVVVFYCFLPPLVCSPTQPATPETHMTNTTAGAAPGGCPDCLYGEMVVLLLVSVIMTFIGQTLPALSSTGDQTHTERIRVVSFWFIVVPCMLVQIALEIPFHWKNDSNDIGHIAVSLPIGIFAGGQIFFLFALGYSDQTPDGKAVTEKILVERRRQISCNRSGGCCRSGCFDRWLHALHNPALYMDFFFLIFVGCLGQIHIVTIIWWSSTHDINDNLWLYNHESFHAILPLFITLMGLLGFFISRYKSLQKRITDYGLTTGAMLFGVIFFLHSQDGNGYGKDSHDFWCMLFITAAILRALVANGSKLRFQLGWVFMWSSWEFAIANLASRFERGTKLEASNAAALMGVISFLVCVYLAWSGSRVRRLLGDGPTHYQFSEIVEDFEEEQTMVSLDELNEEAIGVKPTDSDRPPRGGAAVKSFELA
jgi:hypothetical protein